MGEFAKLTRATYVSGSSVRDGTYAAGLPVYIRPAAVLAVFPTSSGGGSDILVGNSSASFTLQVMENPDEVYKVLQEVGKATDGL